MEKIKVNLAKNEVVVSFNDRFYPMEFVEKAITDFSGICSIKKIKTGILLKPKEDLDINILGYEFYNYALGLMKNQ
jgi:hypothetical protein